MTERSYRATKSVHHDGKRYEVGKVYTLAEEIGDAMPWMVAEPAAGAPISTEPQVVGTSQVVLISITGGAPDADTRAAIDALLASSHPLDVRVTLDELAARAIAALASPAPAVFTAPTPVAMTAEPGATTALNGAGNDDGAGKAEEREGDGDKSDEGSGDGDAGATDKAAKAKPHKAPKGAKPEAPKT